MKASEIEGALLDYWVAKAEGFAEPWLSAIKSGDDSRFSYSTNWVYGGPIIEREHIELRFVDGIWTAMGNGCYGDGQSLLVAAMRAYVNSKFGETVLEEP